MRVKSLHPHYIILASDTGVSIRLQLLSHTSGVHTVPQKGRLWKLAGLGIALSRDKDCTDNDSDCKSHTGPFCHRHLQDCAI